MLVLLVGEGRGVDVVPPDFFDKVVLENIDFLQRNNIFEILLDFSLVVSFVHVF